MIWAYSNNMAISFMKGKHLTGSIPTEKHRI